MKSTSILFVLFASLAIQIVSSSETDDSNPQENLHQGRRYSSYDWQSKRDFYIQLDASMDQLRAEHNAMQQQTANDYRSGKLSQQQFRDQMSSNQQTFLQKKQNILSGIPYY